MGTVQQGARHTLHAHVLVQLSACLYGGAPAVSTHPQTDVELELATAKCFFSVWQPRTVTHLRAQASIHFHGSPANSVPVLGRWSAQE